VGGQLPYVEKWADALRLFHEQRRLREAQSSLVETAIGKEVELTLTERIAAVKPGHTDASKCHRAGGRSGTTRCRTRGLSLSREGGDDARVRDEVRAVTPQRSLSTYARAERQDPGTYAG